jgi:glycosyltransferase involved in cell wall biosynthesis
LAEAVMRSLRASIVIINYNYARFVREAIDSALRQTYSPIEVIVVDDGSTDHSADVIDAYDGRIIRIYKPNGGMASAQNHGFRVSGGDVVLFLDSDDTLDPAALERAVPLFDADDIVKVHGPIWEVDRYGMQTGRVIPNRSLPDGDLRPAVIERGPDACACSPIHGNLWTRKFLQAVLPMPEDLFRRHSDMYLMMLAPLYGRVRSLDEPLGFYRVHGGNDYASRPVDEKNSRNLELYHLRCEILAEHLHRMGIRIDPEAWKKGPGYDWMRRLNRASHDVNTLVPRGGTVILIDDCQWSSPWGDTAIFTGLKTIPFLERDGQFWGRPPDDETAIGELDRLRRAGAEWLVVAWPAYWWLDHYKTFRDDLNSKFPRVVCNDDVIVYDLRDR